MEKKEFVLFKKEKGNHMQTGHGSLILRFHGLLLILFLLFIFLLVFLHGGEVPHIVVFVR